MTKSKAWDTNPVEAFKAFVASDDFARTAQRLRSDGTYKPVSSRSQAIYIFMFKNFANWMGDQGKSFSQLTQDDLKRFINRTNDSGRILNSKIAYRYLRLLDRCFQHLNSGINPAQQAIRSTDRAEFSRDDAGRALSEDQLTRFMAALPGHPPGQYPLHGTEHWKRRRDRAMQVLMIMAGLRVSETIGLLLDEVGRQANVDGSIDLNITPTEKHETSYEHIAPLPREGVSELGPWLKERDKLEIPGQFVFPANLQGAKMIPKTVYMQVRATFERAGIDPARAGGRTLRNTFAQRQLEAGMSPDQLKDILGLALERSAAEYKFVKIKPDTEQ